MEPISKNIVWVGLLWYYGSSPWLAMFFREMYPPTLHLLKGMFVSEDDLRQTDSPNSSPG